jgi:hypothetical protein
MNAHFAENRRNCCLCNPITAFFRNLLGAFVFVRDRRLYVKAGLKWHANVREAPTFVASDDTCPITRLTGVITWQLE